MPTDTDRRAFLRAAAAFVSLTGAGCGTILHPERRGQDAGPLDWKIVLLDAVGLFFFFVPGVIAFAVDFNNGTIYLPPEKCTGQPRPTSTELTQVPIPRSELTVSCVESVVSSHAKADVRLEPGNFRKHSLNHIDEFWPTFARCVEA